MKQLLILVMLITSIAQAQEQEFDFMCEVILTTEDIYCFESEAHFRNSAFDAPKAAYDKIIASYSNNNANIQVIEPNSNGDYYVDITFRGLNLNTSQVPHSRLEHKQIEPSIGWTEYRRVIDEIRYYMESYDAAYANYNSNLTARSFTPISELAEGKSYSFALVNGDVETVNASNSEEWENWNNSLAWWKQSWGEINAWVIDQDKN